MKTIAFLFSLSFYALTNSLFGQQKTLPNSFVFQGEVDKAKIAFYEKSILNASMESFRLKETDVVLKFKEGFECVLYSAKSLFIKGIQVDVNQYKESFDSRYKFPLFSIASDGHLLAEYSTPSKSTPPSK